MIKNKNIIFFLFIFIFISFTSSLYAEEKVRPKEEVIQELKNKDTYDKDLKNEMQSARPQAIKETARILAIQKGVKWRYSKIIQEVKTIKSKLSNIFDFRSFLLHSDRVLPPVIVEAKAGYKVESKTKATSVKNVYKIIQDAQFISVAPSWRDYLLKKYNAFSKKDVQVGVLPKNDEERKMWEEAIDEGWEIGVEQANNLFRINVNKLIRDYKGLIRFQLLHEKGMVDLPIIAKGELGIQVDGRKLDVDQKVFRITKPSGFNKVDEWKPQIGVQ